MDALVITAIVILNAVMGFIQENRAADAVKALAAMTEVMATVIREGEPVQVRAVDLVPGDILSLAEGDQVGADARLISQSSLRISEASLTGESVPVTKNVDPLSGETSLGDRTNMVFKGTAVTQGVGKAVVVATGMSTEMGAIADLLSETQPEPTPLSKELSSLGKVLGLGVIVIAVVVMVAVYLVTSDHSVSALVAIMILGVSLAVAAVPEGLPAIMTVVLSLGVHRMTRRNAIVKDLSGVEALGSASVVASDKTGTLTRNEMTIAAVVWLGGEAEVSGSGYAPDGDVSVRCRDVAAEAVATQTPAASGDPSADSLTVEAVEAVETASQPWHTVHLDDFGGADQVTAILAGGAITNDATLTRDGNTWVIQGDPTDAAFLTAAGKLDAAQTLVEDFTRTGEVPFTSERKLMTVSGQLGHRQVVISKGAPDVLINHCTKVAAQGKIIEFTDQLRKEVLGQVAALADRAFRTIAVGYKPGRAGSGELSETDETDLIYLGVVGMIDPPRAEAAAAVAQAQRAGITVMMITGDHPATAGQIASQLGVTEDPGEVLTGADLDSLTDAEFADAVATISVYARVAPRHKMKIVNALQDQGEIVAMTGDGVNDAPALKAADIGVAMGITGTEVSKEASSMILSDDNFSTIVAAVEEGRSIFDNIRKFLRYLLSSNMGEVFTMFFGIVAASLIGLFFVDPVTGTHVFQVPLLATQILWINLVTDSGPALAMGIDPAIEDVMNRAPRRATDRVIDRPMWMQIIWVGFLMALVTLFVLDYYMPHGLVTSPRLPVDQVADLTVARTAAFTTLVFAQLFNALNSRSTFLSAGYRLWSNPWLIGSIVVGVVLQIMVVEIGFFQVAFGTVALTWDQWLVSIGAASVVLIAEEIRKVALRLRLRRRMVGDLQ